MNTILKIIICKIGSTGGAIGSIYLLMRCMPDPDPLVRAIGAIGCIIGLE